VSAVETFVVRLWLPDRPGALGAVASRIGAVRGDVVGIHILETGGGRAVDELVVRLPRQQLVELLVSEIEQVDGVQVELVRPAGPTELDPGVDGLEIAAVLVGAAEPEELLIALCAHGGRALGAEWTAVVDGRSGQVRRASGQSPEGPWLAAFVIGSMASAASGGEASGTDPGGPDDVAWAPMPAAGLALVVGRGGTAFRARERRSLAAMARIADTRLRELGPLRSRLAHPSTGRL